MESEMRQRAHFTLHTHSMFDIGFSELLVIGIVTLVVVGPERMPKVARTAGLLLGRVQRYVNSVKADISREIQLDELKRLQSEMQESARSFEQSMNQEIRAIESSVQDSVDSVEASIQQIAGSVNDTPEGGEADKTAPTTATTPDETATKA